ncbi:Autophagy-related protein 8C-like [Camellia lanceoleosa]|uniref:Autophagy-related protein 8C-like n=1 Tax=Camellia lanceoleosa TaxID=1840588 RepID=A0ACC0IK99_9ERIC|nr:Autophagy-related protein 8C-like [Camellia lanceoleosa]
MEEVKGSDAEAEKNGGALKFDVNSDSADLKPVSLQGRITGPTRRSSIGRWTEKEIFGTADLIWRFVYVVQKRIKLGAEKAIFIFVKNILPPTAAMMSTIYGENKDEEGFLYMTYSGKNTFGSI